MLSNTNISYIQFNTVVKLWNALPVIDILLSTPVLKCKSKLVLVVAFYSHFHIDNTCTWY